MSEFEKRYLPVEEMEVEQRQEEDGSMRISGYAAKFNRKSEDLGGFREIIRPGAFRGALNRDDLDVKLLFNHDPSTVMARTKNGTLKLDENTVGLKYEAELNDTQTARDLYKLIQRGDVDQSSFAFRVADDGLEISEESDGLALRTVKNIAELGDVSPVTYPAYKSSTVSARALEQAGINFEQLNETVERLQRGHNTEDDRAVIDDAVEKLRSLTGHPETCDEDSSGLETGQEDTQSEALVELELMERELELLQLKIS